MLHAMLQHAQHVATCCISSTKMAGPFASVLKYAWSMLNCLGQRKIDQWLVHDLSVWRAAPVCARGKIRAMHGPISARRQLFTLRRHRLDDR